MIGNQILKCWEEAVGRLSYLGNGDGCLLATIGPVRICLPFELEEKLSTHVGEKVGVLRTDDTTRPYRIRLIRQQ